MEIVLEGYEYRIGWGVISIWVEWKGKLGRWIVYRLGFVIVDMCIYGYSRGSSMYFYD